MIEHVYAYVLVSKDFPLRKKVQRAKSRDLITGVVSLEISSSSINLSITTTFVFLVVIRILSGAMEGAYLSPSRFLHLIWHPEIHFLGINYNCF